MKQETPSLSWKVTNSIWYVLGRALPTKMYLSLRYRLLFGRNINWANPKFFTEKLQWLKVYGYGKSQTLLVDKVKVKAYVSEKIGSKYVIPTIAVWNSPNEIDVSSLSDGFVLKCNHDSGSIVLCRNKDEIDIDIVKKELAKVFHSNYYWSGRETPYKYVERKVFAEKLIQSSKGQELMDYKFFCFNGEPKIFKVDFDRFVDHHANYYNINCKLLPFGETWPPPNHTKEIIMPDNFSEMVEIAKKLSDGLPFARVDLYNNDGEIFFGEITLFPTSGFGPFTDEKWDKQLGDWLVLHSKK